MHRWAFDVKLPPSPGISQVPLFFEGAPAASAGPAAQAPAEDPSYVADFLATSEGLDLVKAFVSIEDPELRRAIVRLVQALAMESA